MGQCSAGADQAASPEENKPLAKNDGAKKKAKEAKDGKGKNNKAEKGDNEEDSIGQTPENEEAENSDDCDSSDEFELNMRAINPRNVDNADEMGDDFGMSLLSKDDMQGNGLFAIEDTGEGECFMAVKPWLGSIVEPEQAPENNPSAPDETLEMEHVYGYAGHIRSCVFTNPEAQPNCVIYPAASVTVVHNTETNRQPIFCRGQTDDVTCIAQNPSNPSVFATGQVATIVKRRGTLPHISVFDATTGETLTKIEGAHRRAVRCLCFSPCGKYLASVGDDNEYTLSVWEVETGKNVASMKSGTSKIFGVAWNPHNSKELVMIGTNVVLFWDVDVETGALKSSRGRFGSKFTRQTFYALTFSPKGYALCGGVKGHVYVFVNRVCRAAKKVHKGAVYTIACQTSGHGCTEDEPRFFTGGRDGFLRVLDNKMALVSEHKFDAKVRSLHLSTRGDTHELFVGTTNGIYQVSNEAMDLLASKTDASAEKEEEKKEADDEAGAEAEPSVQGSSKCVVRAHCNGELWAIATNPANANEFATAGEDNQVFVWDACTHQCLKRGIVNAVKGPKYKRRKAGTTSTESPNRCVRSLAYSPDGRWLVMGVNSGEVHVMDTTSEDLKVVVSHDLNSFSKRKVTGQHGNWIQTMAFSPKGDVLAVGTHGLCIVLLDCAGDEPTFKPVTALKTHNSAITHIDWSVDGEHLQSTCNAYELLFHDVARGDDGVSASHNPKPSTLTAVQWATQTCQFGWPVQGVFAPSQDGTDINVCAKNADETLLATGDDYGNVNLYRYPCVESTNEKHVATGHASHVMNVLFATDNSFLLSVGGNDKCAIQWKLSTLESETE